MKTSNKTALVLGLLVLGATLQNFIWYLRLQTPILLREFNIYFRVEGAKVFLIMNSFNYFAIQMLLVTWLIFFLIDKRRDELRQSLERSCDENN